MPILTANGPALTAAQATAAQIRDMARLNYKTILAAQKRGVEVVWQNGRGLTPQQACDSLGTDAAQLFRFHGLLTDLVLAIQQLEGLPTDLALPTNAFTLNIDGTVTVDPETPYAP